MAMSSISRKEYLREVRRLYKKAKTKKEKGELISNVVDITGMHRKQLLRYCTLSPSGAEGLVALGLFMTQPSIRPC